MSHDDVRALHRRLLDAWNARDAADYASAFAHDGVIIGFDGSEMVGRAAIAEHLGGIFASHPTGRYVAKVLEVRSVAEPVFLLRAIAGLIPVGADDVKPELNAVQTLVATRVGGHLRVVLFQNTPAQLHGRPDDVAAMTAELSALR
jgi:uncharacterized protein (TIGR02246 family)